MAPAAPALTLPSPPKGRGRQERVPRAGMTAVGRQPPACHPRAWPLHGGRDARRASPFPDSSPPPGERIKERGGRTAQAESKGEGGRAAQAESKGEGGRAAQAESKGGGDVPRGSRWRQQPPSPSPLPPRGEGDKNEQRAGMTAAGGGVLQGIWLSGCMAVCMSANLAGCGDTTAGCAVARGGRGPANGRGCRGRGGLLLGGARGSISEGQGGLKRCG